MNIESYSLHLRAGRP